MSIKWFSRKLIVASLCAAVAFAAIGAAYVPLSQVASAASAYETTITYGVNLRTQPSASAIIIRMLPKGEAVHVVGQANSYWLQVNTAKGESGYISSSSKYSTYSGTGNGSGGSSTQPSSGSGTGSSGSSTQPSTSSKADQVISLAQSYIGKVKYVFGVRDASKLTFDCSSFTQFIFAKVGVNLQWGTKYQKSEGVAVSRANLQKGDLVFFDTIGANNGVINHVGIYMGNGQIIQNIPSKGVTVSSLTSGYWSDHYVSARRVL